MKERKTIKGINYRNSYGAYFEKDANSEEGYFHFCDQYQREYVPIIWEHDVNSIMFVGNEKIHINYCPLCGKRLD